MANPIDTIELGNGWGANIYHDDSAENPREWHNVAVLHCAHRRYDLGDIQHNSSETAERALFDAMGDHPMLAACREYLDESRWGELSDTLGDVYRAMTDRDNWDSTDCAKSVRAWPMNMPRILGPHWRDHTIGQLAGKLDSLGLTDCESAPLYLFDHSGLAISTGAFSCPWDSGQIGRAIVTKAQAIAELGATESDWRAKARQCIEFEVSTYDDYLQGACYGYVITRPNGQETEESCWGFLGYDHEKSGLMHHARDDLLSAQETALAELAQALEALRAVRSAPWPKRLGMIHKARGYARTIRELLPALGLGCLRAPEPA